ncbi:MAG: hypothetical protein ACE5K0_10470 [Candidatus Methanofastidiosia archaeon]
MKISEVLNKSIDVVSRNPVIFVPYLVPMVLQLIIGVVWLGQVGRWAGFTPPRGLMGPEEAMRFWQEMMTSFLPTMGMSFLLGILSWIFVVIATAMAIVITLDSLKKRKSTLSGAFNMVSDKLIVLIIAIFVVKVLTGLGFCAFIIGAIIVAILLAFVPQGIVVDGLSFGETFSKSYNIAKSNFLDVFLVLLVFFVVGVVVGFVPVIGNVLKPFIGAFATAALTILYLDRK